MDKRTFLKTSLLGLGGMILLPSFIKGRKNTKEKFKLPELKFNSLEPFLDTESIADHYNNHHKLYSENLVSLVKKYNIEKLSIQEILNNISKYPEDLRFNAGGYFNHNLFWYQLTSEKKNISSILLDAIESNFGSFENFKQEFSKAASSLFGSGWTWLIIKPDKTLKVVNTYNNDNPLMDIAEENGRPLLVLDVWEHAYYKKYQNRRIDYINNFWNFIDWEYVSMKYKILINKKLYI